MHLKDLATIQENEGNEQKELRKKQENKVIKLNRISRLSFISKWNLSSFFPSINFTVLSSIGEGNDNPF